MRTRFRPMGSGSEKLDKAYAEWRTAEEKYAASLKRHLSGKPSSLGKDAALELAELRSRATSRMDKFFKRALS